MLLKKRIERAFALRKKQSSELPQEEIHLEKGDFFSLTLAGLVSFVLPALAALALIAGIVYLLLL